jgi:hypothetical protein
LGLLGDGLEKFLVFRVDFRHLEAFSLPVLLLKFFSAQTLYFPPKSVFPPSKSKTFSLFFFLVSMEEVYTQAKHPNPITACR